MKFWVGGWGASLGGECEGIGLVTAGEPDSPLSGGPLGERPVVAADSPSWLAAGDGVVYAALEASGRVAAFRRVGEDRLEPWGEAVEAGESVCHLGVYQDHLVASCWGDGRVVHVPLARDGSLGKPSVAEAAADPYGVDHEGTNVAALLDGEGTVDAAELLAGGAVPADIAALLAGSPELPTDWEGAIDLGALVGGEADASRIAGLLAGNTSDDPLAGVRALLGAERNPFDDPAVRGILAASAPVTAESREGRTSRAHASAKVGNGLIATTDLGVDLVRFWTHFARGMRLHQEVVLPFGTGPRHLVWHPSGHLYVLTELSHEVFVLAADRDGRWRLIGGTPCAPGALAGDTGAEIALGRDGETVLAGLRGSDTLAVLRVRGVGDRLEPIALVETGVTTPRHHVVGRDAVLVAGQRSHEVVSLPLDARTGIPGRVAHRVATASPTCLLPTR